MTLDSVKSYKTRLTKMHGRADAPDGRHVSYFFFVFILIFLYGLKYSSVYPATNQANPASRAAAIHFMIVTMLYSILFESGFVLLPLLSPSFLWKENATYMT